MSGGPELADGGECATNVARFAGIRCCTGDEGRPLGIGVQAQVPNHLKLQALRAPVVNVEEKASPRACQVKSRETSVSEPLRTCRKSLDDVKTGGSLVNPGAVWGETCECIKKSGSCGQRNSFLYLKIRIPTAEGGS